MAGPAEVKQGEWFAPDRRSVASFLQKLMSKWGPAKGPARVYVGAFGKHPGWDDHIDDLGLETDRLVELKRLLYLHGVAGNIDSGAWERLEQQQQAVPFHHVFLWSPGGNGGDIVAGRMWSSRDGKGRSRYPMVVAAQCSELPLEWVLTQVLPQLERVEAACTATAYAAEVRAIIDRARVSLRGAVSAPAPPPLPPDPAAMAAAPAGQEPVPVAYLAARPEMGEGRKGLVSVVYRVEEEMEPYVRDAFRVGRSDPHRLAIRPGHLRVPACADTAGRALRVWVGFLTALLDPATPMMLFFHEGMPSGQAWVDLIAGEPTVSVLYAIRASPQALPLTTQIPYTIDEQVVRRAEQFIASQGGNGRPQPAP
jgi:hypothetical protein